MEIYRTIKVLIVEDNRTMTYLVGEQVSTEHPDAKISYAFTLEDAILKYDKIKPDFVLLDVRLAKKSGFDLLKHIRLTPSKTKVIMVTNYNSDFYRAKSLKLGADFFVDKTKDFTNIPRIIDSVPYIEMNPL